MPPASLPPASPRATSRPGTGGQHSELVGRQALIQRDNRLSKCADVAASDDSGVAGLKVFQRRRSVVGVSNAASRAVPPVPCSVHLSPNNRRPSLLEQREALRWLITIGLDRARAVERAATAKATSLAPKTAARPPPRSIALYSESAGDQVATSRFPVPALSSEPLGEWRARQDSNLQSSDP
jgi:hypothetical protein